MAKEDGLTVLFYPPFDNSEEFTDHYYRMIWYLNPLRERIRRIIMPYEGEMPAVGELPYYLDPAIKRMADESGIAGAVELVSSEPADLLESAARDADIVLVWHIDANQRDRVPDGSVKGLVMRKKRYLIDHKHVQYAGSFYVRLSQEICTDKVTVRECSEKFKAIPADKLCKTGYIFGTGPSLKLAAEMDLSDGTSIVCNTIVKNKELMGKLKPSMIVFSDAIFHAGCSTYAGDFRRHLTEAMVDYNSYLIVPMRDYALYMANLDPSLQGRLIGVPIIPPNVTPNVRPDLDLYRKFQVAPSNSVLTQFLIPLAATFFKKTFMLGFDGRPLNQDDYFWKHDPASQLVDRMNDIKVAHPAFFQISYNDHYVLHCRAVARWLDEAEKQGRQFLSLTPSYVPALKCRQVPSRAASTRADRAPMVSIIMPALNAYDTITGAIASIQSQDLADWELLVVDDGSSDNTRPVVANLAATDSRIRLLECRGRGVSDARNTGLDSARGEFVTFLDADDFMYPDALKRRVEALANNPGWNLVHCPTEMVNANAEKLGWQTSSQKQISFKHMGENRAHINSIMGRASIFKALRFETDLTNGEDWLFISDALRSGEISHRVDRCSVAYVVRRDSAVCRDYVSHEHKVLEVLDMVYSPVRNNLPTAPEFAHGLCSPPKEKVMMRRRIGLLTWLLLEQRAQDITTVLSEVNTQASSALSRGEIRNQIVYPAMRFYVCRQEELAKRLRQDKTALLRLIAETGIERTFPQYAREFKSVMRKVSMTKLNNLIDRVLYGRLIDHLAGNYPAIITVGRVVKWSLATLKKTFFGIGGIALLVIAGLYIAGALIEPARWYLVGIASALLLLGGGMLALFYVRSAFNSIISDQRRQLSGINKQVSDTKKRVSDVNKQVSDVKKQVSDIDREIWNIRRQISDSIVGPFIRSDHAYIDEHALMGALLIDHTKTGVMVDVGAQYGSALAPFYRAGWRVFAFEPDPTNRKELETRFGDKPNLTIDSRAVADHASKNMPFYSSPESPGISTLHPFRKSHKEACKVSTTTIADFVREKDLHNIDYLKIDAEGYDLLILKGVPWDSIKPNVIMCEFEDSKTEPLGYTMHDMARYLVEHGYEVLVSEWHPVIRYGIRQDWHRLVPYPCELNNPNTAGNLIAFRDQPGLLRIATIARGIVKVDAENTG
jgi:FkbM family methyltransferase